MRRISITEACREARLLIIRDGFMTGGGGWVGDGGWCIEGALAQVLEVRSGEGSTIEYEVNRSEVGLAIREYLVGKHLLCPSGALHGWNDRHATKEKVLEVLAEVALLHKPKALVVPIIIPPMPVVADGSEVPDLSDGFWQRLWGALTASDTEPVPEPTEDPAEPSEAPQEPSGDPEEDSPDLPAEEGTEGKVEERELVLV